MDILEKARTALKRIAAERCLAPGEQVTVRTLTPSEVIGSADETFVVKKGKERVIEARFRDVGKPVVFFGNTISGVAALLSLERICPFGR